ncbi:MAG TPA: DNA polymerase [Acidimicrobiales bacterium]
MSEPSPLRRGTTDGADCASCPFAKDGKAARPVVGIGPDDPDWILVGEGPGRAEVEWGQPFVGPTGGVVNRMLEETGIPRRRLYVTNVTLCQPPPGPAGKEAMRELAASACRGRLKAELGQFPGRPILAAGGVAARELLLGQTTLTKITDLTGTYHEVDVDGSGPRGVVPTVHPAAMLRGMRGGDGEGNKDKTSGHASDVGYWSLKFDALKVNALAKGKEVRLKVPELIDIEVSNPARANKLIAELYKEIVETGFFALDLETHVEDEQRNFALQAWAARITLLGLSTKKRAISVSWKLLTQHSKRLLGMLLSNPALTKAFHNLAYDTAVLQNPAYRYRIINSWSELPKVEDTMLADHAAFPGAPHNLQAVGCRYRAIPPWKAEYRDSEDTPEQAATYNATDVLVTAKTVDPLHIWVKKTETERVYDVDRKMALLAGKMHLWGYYIDRDVNAEMQRRLGEHVEVQRQHIVHEFEANRDKTIDRLLFEYARTRRKADPADLKERIEVRRQELEKEIAKGRWAFSPGNDNHMVALMRTLGVPLMKFTPSGKSSTSADALEAVAHHPIVAHLMRYRDNEQLLSTFVIRMFEWTQDSNKKWRPPYVQDDGRCHPLWSVNKISGRWGSAQPMSQNLPEGDETNADPIRQLPNVRRQYTAAPGKILVGFDFEQLEMRLMALQSGDPFLCRVFSQGLDIHGEFAKILFPQFAALEVGGPEYTRLRTTTKRFEYGGLYGGSDDTVWRSVVVDEPSITLKMVSVAIAKMKQAVRGVLDWQARLLRETSQPPYTLKSYILGRRRVFPLGNPPPTDVNNNPNQFAGSDVMNIGMARFLPCLDKYVKRGVETAYPIFQIHDAAYIECDEGDEMKVAKDVKESFTQRYRAANGTEIDFPIELKIGYALHSEPKDKDKEKHPQLVWPVGRPGLVKVKV